MTSSPGLGCSAADVGDEPASSRYLDRLMRRGCFEALWPLFAKAQRPAKELTESYSALAHLRPFMRGAGPYRVLHVGDGAHARTGAMFALKTPAHNVSIDPQLNLEVVGAWRERFGIRRLDCYKGRVQDLAEELNAMPKMPTLVTFVHAHVAVDDILRLLRWDAAFSLACCTPRKQLSREHAAHSAGHDSSVLSTARQYQVLCRAR
jgi:hypothetical protein